MIRFSGILLLAVIVVFASCKNGNETGSTTTVAPYDYSQLEGNYRGDFGGGGDIVVSLRHVTERNAVGFDLHKGLRRNISGDIFPAANGFKFVMHEPGDNQYDGIFEFTLDTSSNQITGLWKPSNTASLGKKDYTLKKVKSDTSKTAINYDRAFADSIGELHFELEGLCIYRYYPKTGDSSGKEQYREVKGNWKMSDGKYIIDWQKNELFKNKQSIFKVIKDDNDDNYFKIEGEGRMFYITGEAG